MKPEQSAQSCVVEPRWAASQPCPDLIIILTSLTYNRSYLTKTQKKSLPMLTEVVISNSIQIVHKASLKVFLKVSGHGTVPLLDFKCCPPYLKIQASRLLCCCHTVQWSEVKCSVGVNNNNIDGVCLVLSNLGSSWHCTNVTLLCLATLPPPCKHTWTIPVLY